MRIACLGGGPAGLYFAISMKLRDPAHEIDLFERNRHDDQGGEVRNHDEASGQTTPAGAGGARRRLLPLRCGDGEVGHHRASHVAPGSAG